MRTVMLCFLLFSTASVLFSDKPSAPLNITFDLGENLRLPARDKAFFDGYLRTRRLHLLENISQLQFSEKFVSIVDFLKIVDVRTPEHPNRQIHCSFLKRLGINLNKSDHRELMRLTDNLKYCVPGDVPREKREAWTTSIVRFIWERPWVNNKTTTTSLSDWILEKLAETDFLKPPLISWTTDEPDAFYSNQSKHDLAFVTGNKYLTALNEFLKNYNINDKSSIPARLGRELIGFEEKRRLLFLDAFIAQRGIYFSSTFGPADVVDFLVHEFGHIYFDDPHSHFSGQGGNLTYSKHRTHDEAAAETLAWLVLRELYVKFPEIEFSHIIKLYAFSILRPEDPHYVGAGSVFKIFERKRDNEIEIYKDLVTASSFENFLKKNGGAAVEKVGQKNTLSLRIDIN